MESVFENLKDTCEGKIAAEIEKLYAELEKQQSDWYKKQNSPAILAAECAATTLSRT